MFKFAVKLVKNEIFPLKVNEDIDLQDGQMILVKTEKGNEVAKVILIGKEQSRCIEKMKEKAIPFVRIMTPADLEFYEELKKQEYSAFLKCKELVSKHKLQMSLIQAKYTFDKKKISFSYTAPERVDFRELLKDLTKEFKKVRIDLRHVGVRDESAILEGKGLCGRNFCCCTWLRSFESINIKLAKDQGMPITPSKISGVCGRLLCCLNYEYKNYIEYAKEMPPIGSSVMTKDGAGKVCSLSFLNNKISVKFENEEIKEYGTSEIEMIDADINIDISTNHNSFYQIEDDENIDVSQLED